MIYITGDTHIPIDIAKLNSKRFHTQKELSKEDFLIICGDFGGVWNNDNEELYWRKWLDKKNFTTLFIDGNHENFNLLDSFETIDFAGGKVHKISDSIYHLMRGEIYTIDTLKFFVFGGATSHDKEFRIEGKNWWREELPSAEELENAVLNLTSINFDVDYIITHCAPSSIQEEISDKYKRDVLTDFFEEIKEKVSFKTWFFGHYHIDNKFNDRFICLFNKVQQI